MRRGAAAVAVVVLAGAIGLAVQAAADSRETAFAVGAPPGLVAANLARGDEACQAGVGVPRAFRAVRFQVGTFARPGPPLRLRVNGAARGRLPGGYPDGFEARVDVGIVRPGRRAEICFENVGSRRVALYGVPSPSMRDNYLLVRGRKVKRDLTLVFLTGEPRSALSLVPEIFRRASLFGAAWVGPWTFWLLLAAVVVVLPALLAAAVGSVRDEEA